MIEAHNSLYNYDIISLCETSLTEESTAEVPVIDGYTYEPGNRPDNISRGGVGIYYKDSLPVVVRRNLHAFYFISNTFISNTRLKFAHRERQISENIAMLTQ